MLLPLGFMNVSIVHQPETQASYTKSELYTSFNQLVDTFYYDGNAPYSSGAALELIDPLLNNDSSDSNWSSSTSYIQGSGGLSGTPGSINNQNSDFGDPLINEFSMQVQNNGYADFGNQSEWAFSSADFSINYWIKFNEWTVHDVMIGKVVYGAGWALKYMASEGNLRFTVVWGNEMIFPFNMSLDQWYFFNIIQRDGVLEVWIDNQLIISDDRGNFQSTNASLKLGGDPQYSNFTNANYDDFSIWDKALNLDEMQRIRFSQIIPANESGLVAYYPFDEGEGTTVNDVANGLSGSLVGTSSYSVDTPVAVYGCMDETSPDYNPEANVDDGSCTYIPDVPIVHDTEGNPLIIGGDELITLWWKPDDVTGNNNNQITPKSLNNNLRSSIQNTRVQRDFDTREVITTYIVRRQVDDENWDIISEDELNIYMKGVK